MASRNSRAGKPGCFYVNLSFLSLLSREKFCNRPDVIREARFHRGRHAQGLMQTAEVVVSKLQRNGCLQVRQFLTEGVRQPRESANPHPGRVVAEVESWKFSKIIDGRPDEDHISTSFVERQNLTMRMQMRRFTRLTNAFSKKLAHLKAVCALHFAHYNFCRVHQSLRATPAMAAGFSTEIWPLDALLG
jgi:hypothetical protein